MNIHIYIISILGTSTWSLYRNIIEIWLVWNVALCWPNSEIKVALRDITNGTVASVHGSWDWIRISFLLTQIKADSKIQLTWFVGSGQCLLLLHLLSSSLFLLFITIDHLASILCRPFSLSWTFCFSLVPSGPQVRTSVSITSDPFKQTNKHVCRLEFRRVT